MNKGNIILTLLVLFVGLSACQNNGADSNSSQHNSITPIESPSEPPERVESPSESPADSIESSPYWWTPPEKPAPATINDAVYWEQQFWYIFNTYPDKYEWGDEPGMNSNHLLWGGDEPRMLGFVPLLYRDGIIGQLDKNNDNKIQNAILRLEDFSTLTSLYFGPVFAAGITPGNAQFSGTVINDEPVDVMYENGKFLIPFTEKYTELPNNLGFKFVKAIPLEDDLSRVELVANGYNVVWGRDGEDDSLILSRTHSYILRWDGRVGYVPEKITWEYVPTDRVSLQGDNIQEISVLWDNAEPTGYAHQAYRDQTDDIPSSQGYPIHVNGEDVYQFRKEENRILYDHINLESFEQSTGQILITAESDMVPVIWRVGDGVAVFADNTLFQFDGALHLQRQYSVPESIPIIGDTAVINEQFTMAAYFSGNDLYLYDFEKGESRLIYTHVYEDASDMDLRWYGIYPVRFTKEGHIFIGVGYWEHRAIQYLLISQKGEKLVTVDWAVSEEHSGGYSFSDSAGAFHDHGYDDSTSWQYINFITHKLKDIAYMPFNFGGGMGMIAIPSPQISHQWCFSVPRGPWELPDETAFYIVDFDTETCTELPLKVIGARASLMAVSKSGRLLFNYAYNGERGYGVYTPSAA